MIPNTITDTDMIVLENVESYLKNMGAPIPQNPQEALIIKQQARDYLYSDIVRRVPRIAAYLMSADMESDTIAQGLWFALSRHVMDPVFVEILLQHLAMQNNAEENGITGALLTKIMSKWLEQNFKGEASKPKTAEEKKKEAKKDAVVVNTVPVIKNEEQKPDLGAIKHIEYAINQLLGNLAGVVATRCGNLTHTEALSIAACIAMNNKDTIKEIIASDLPITAQLFDVVVDPSNLIKSALLLEKTEVLKNSTNQQAFLDSLKRWVFDKLNVIPTQTSYQFLVAAYGSVKPDVSKYYIQIKECGTQYSNLLVVAKQLINQ